MSDERGFTLVEMLVAAVLFAQVMMLATEGLRSALAGWRAAERRAAHDARVADAQRVVRRLVSEAWPDLVRGTDGHLELAFDGGPARLRLLAMVPPGAGMMSAVELRLDGGALVAVVAAVDPASRQPFEALDDGRAEVLVDGLAGGGFSYGGDDGRWSDSWRGRTELPRLTRLRLSFPAGDRRVWPELAVASPAESMVDLR
ncbi:MAG: prepilin-type N-terminal cleavage/methylation domain-containing protein [Pseudomonadota bacterium]